MAFRKLIIWWIGPRAQPGIEQAPLCMDLSPLWLHFHGSAVLRARARRLDALLVGHPDFGPGPQCRYTSRGQPMALLTLTLNAIVAIICKA